MVRDQRGARAVDWHGDRQRERAGLTHLKLTGMADEGAVVTREEWIRRYATHMVQGGSWMTEDQAIASAEGRADASEQAGDTNPDAWEAPEVVAEEDLASEA